MPYPNPEHPVGPDPMETGPTPDTATSGEGPVLVPELLFRSQTERLAELQRLEAMLGVFRASGLSQEKLDADPDYNVLVGELAAMRREVARDAAGRGIAQITRSLTDM
ncbi:MAG TPA: hypothetical protein VLE99_05185 [Candidatus Saccharimonadales bacterium]|nr:hypothetical protein [Candidatus Saccharimonadales bacterium]